MADWNDSLPEGVAAKIEEVMFFVEHEDDGFTRREIYAKANFMGTKAMLTGKTLTEDEALLFAPFLKDLGAESVVFYKPGAGPREYTEVLLI